MREVGWAGRRGREMAEANRGKERFNKEMGRRKMKKGENTRELRNREEERVRDTTRNGSKEIVVVKRDRKEKGLKKEG